MRGIEAALTIYAEVQDGAFASEAIRRHYTNISPSERTLAATLVYCSLRREGLWKSMVMNFCKRDPRTLSNSTYDALIVGIAGIVELRHFALPVLINAIVQSIKSQGQEENVPLVNAVLHTVADESEKYLLGLKKSSALRDQALYWGVPGWVASQWSKDMSIPEAKKMVRMMGMKTYLSLRLSNGVNMEEYLERYTKSGRKGWASTFLPMSVRTASNPYPLELPGYGEGQIAPQSESSIFVGETVARKAKGKRMLDMCCGRGVKTAQIADSRPELSIEAWDLSEPRIRAAEFEMMRLNAQERVTLKSGNALELTPDQTPDFILLDAPCSGSGTWGRHPEGKWRATPDMVKENSELQVKLLERAVSLVAPGGMIFYSTCSSFKEENEIVLASVMSKHPEIMEVQLDVRKYKFISRGKPYGINIYPALPWVDGFYLAVLAKRK
ncbi:MAG: RsmB/NOP family class I SAM-dependent RNA methyltransferase [Synergistaceae bacterium]